MAEWDVTRAVSRFPPPPHIYEEFVDDSTFPYDPPKPVEGEYAMFGVLYNTNEPLPKFTGEIEGRPKLFEDVDVENVNLVKELKKLNRSLLFNFLDLLETLVESPAHWNDKVEDIQTIVAYVHHVLNCYRPYQARHSIQNILSDQITRCKDDRNAINDQIQEIRAVLDGCKNMMEFSDTDIPTQLEAETKDESGGKEGADAEAMDVDAIAPDNDSRLREHAQSVHDELSRLMQAIPRR